MKNIWLEVLHKAFCKPPSVKIQKQKYCVGSLKLVADHIVPIRET